MSQYLLFGDIETGGLNGRIENGKLGMEYYPIFELAFIVTDANLEQIGEPLRLVVHQSEDNINKSHAWALDAHEKTGLLKEVRLSELTLERAEKRVIAWLMSLGIKKYNRKDKTGAMFAGNSIMFDRSYLMCQMPELHEYMHYRQLDVSALALATRLWKPELEKQVVKNYKHEALADIKETISELKVYRSLF